MGVLFGVFRVGKRGYIWGVNRSSENNEWVLVSATSWVFPSSNTLEMPLVWSVSAAEEVIVGLANTSDFEMITEVVIGEPPLLSGKGWLQLHFSGEELLDEWLSGWSADPDGDGLSNEEEFAFATNPRSSDFPFFDVSLGGLNGEYLVFSAPKQRNASVSYAGKVSSDLENWESGEDVVLVEEETPFQIIFRDLTPRSESPKRFGKVEANVAP